jgi:thioester reductase-like protein
LHIAGCTGFVGAFLLKELLSNTHATIYTLIRCADDESPMARLQQVLSDLQIWGRLQPEHKNKIVALSGNLEMDLFGLSSVEYSTLQQKIGIITEQRKGME